MAQSAKFKSSDKKFEIRDKLRLEPIMTNNIRLTKHEKVKECQLLLQKKHLMDRTLQISLERMQTNKIDRFENMFKLKSNITIKKKN
jgi:hypothetical protein